MSEVRTQPRSGKVRPRGARSLPVQERYNPKMKPILIDFTVTNYENSLREPLTKLLCQAEWLYHLRGISAKNNKQRGTLSAILATYLLPLTGHLNLRRAIGQNAQKLIRVWARAKADK